MDSDVKQVLTEEEEEREHFQRIITAFRYYRVASVMRLNKTRVYLDSLPARHRQLLESYSTHLEEIQTAIDHNYEIIKLIIKDVESMFENVQHCADKRMQQRRPQASDMEKLQSTLKQFVRDWSEDGAKEREQSYQPIIEEVERRFPPDTVIAQDIKVLVPGAGLGRLAFEIARRGYTCQGNEFSLFMLFASNFVLNKCRGVNTLKLYPWVHQTTNNLRAADQLHSITFPDIDPTDLPESAQFSMAAGDFLEVYTELDHWDCVATSFFIDCAKNIVSFIETIYMILKPGGFWINLGPLLYHFADVPGEDSIEPAYEHIKPILMAVGFEILKENTSVRTAYAQNAASMLKYEYDSVFFVCRKPGNRDPSAPHMNGTS